MHLSKTLTLVTLLAVLGMTACDSGPATGAQDQPLRSVRAAEVEVEQGVRELRMSGITRASRRATLAFLVSGTLVERAGELGGQVKSGDVIGRLYNPSLEPAVAAGEARLREFGARLEQLQRDLQRATDLRGRDLISQEDLERVSTNLAATEAARDLAAAELAEARNRDEQSRLLAPFDGSITEVRFEIGEYVAAGQPVMRLSAIDAFEVAFAVPESLIDRFAPGREVELTLSFVGGQTVSGRVVRIGDSGGEAGGLFPVEIALEPAPVLRPGLTVELVVPMASVEAHFVPLAAILDPGTGRPRVFRITDGQVEPVYVGVGQLFGDRVQVTGELKQGDRVAVTGLSGLIPGQSVEILE